MQQGYDMGVANPETVIIVSLGLIRVAAMAARKSLSTDSAS